MQELNLMEVNEVNGALKLFSLFGFDVVIFENGLIIDIQRSV